MSKTYRVNPETYEEEQERNYLKRKKEEEQRKRISARMKIRNTSSADFDLISPNDNCDEQIQG